MIWIYFKGLALGASLIIAIGAQNAFVLSQGVRKRYNIIIPLICAVCDGILISIGVLGVGSIMASNPLVSKITAIGGALFLGYYGYRSFKSFLKSEVLEEDNKGPSDLKSAVLVTLAVTLLNPHVYLDTILLLGGISSQYENHGRIFFGAGAISASFIWFFSLSFGGRLLSGFFKKPRAWKILDLSIALVMWFIAFSLIRGIL